MKNLTKPEFEDVLLDVRKSYRLLYLYQKRIQDLVKYIGDSFGYPTPGGHPKFSSYPIKPGKRGVVDYWAWDWLSMYCFDFHYGEKTFTNEVKVKFSALLLSDTGFFQSSFSDKLDISTFADTDKSDSLLILIAGKNAWDMPELIDDGDSMRQILPLDNVGKGYVRKVNEGIVVTKAYALANFINEEETVKQLQDFQIFCNANSISELYLIGNKPVSYLPINN